MHHPTDRIEHTPVVEHWLEREILPLGVGCRTISVVAHFRLSHGREREMFYLKTHSTHFIYGYMASDIWLRIILIMRKETRCRHIGYSYRLTARVLLYAPSHRQDSTYHGLCYTSRGALAGTRNIAARSRLSHNFGCRTESVVAHFPLSHGRERERNVLFEDALNTFYLRLYGVRHMVKDHSDSEKGNPLPPHRLLLSINSKGSSICTIPQTG